MSTDHHKLKVERIQRQVKDHYTTSKSIRKIQPLSLNYASESSFVTRRKSYKTGPSIDCSHLNQILKIDTKKMTVIVEPRVTFDQLVQATLNYGLTVPVIPELKNITVGGAISGIGAESGSHRWGCVNDLCLSFEIITGDGQLLHITPQNEPEIFYGFPGSYGSLGILVQIELPLIPAQNLVKLNYLSFKTPKQAVDHLKTYTSQLSCPDFIDGIILSDQLSVVIEANFTDDPGQLPMFGTQNRSSPFYFQHVQEVVQPGKSYSEIMTTYDYFFRYDLGAFWMGAYLFYPLFFAKFFTQGWMHWSPSKPFTEKEVARYCHVPHPGILPRYLLHPFMQSHYLCKVLHQSEKWIENHCIIQDLCIPQNQTDNFLNHILESPNIYPIWLLPIKGTKSPQIFAPHVVSDSSSDLIINFGIYGIPSTTVSTQALTKKLEKKVQALGGRKVLYSHSYYTRNQFWEIYNASAYEYLRKKLLCEYSFRDIVDKVLPIQNQD